MSETKKGGWTRIWKTKVSGNNDGRKGETHKKVSKERKLAGEKQKGETLTAKEWRPTAIG